MALGVSIMQQRILFNGKRAGYALGCLILAWGAPVRGQFDAPRLGKPHPPVVLPVVGGQGAIGTAAFAKRPLLIVHFSTESAEVRAAVETWHMRTRPLVEAGKLTVIGVAHDFHAERAELFRRWKKIDWPIGHDQVNVSGVTSLPQVVAVGADGRVAAVDDKGVEAFLTQVEAAPKPDTARPEPEAVELPDPRHVRRDAGEERTVRSQKALAAALIFAGAPGQLNEAIQVMQAAVKSPKECDAMTHFILGAAHRIRFESEGRQDSDFLDWLREWRTAAGMAPDDAFLRSQANVFIGDAGIGPGKEDWTAAAARELRKRGGKPVQGLTFCFDPVAIPGDVAGLPSIAGEDAAKAVRVEHALIVPKGTTDGSVFIVIAAWPRTGMTWADGPAGVTFDPLTGSKVTMPERPTPFSWVSGPTGPRMAIVRLTVPKVVVSTTLPVRVYYSVAAEGAAQGKALKQAVAVKYVRRKDAAPKKDAASTKDAAPQK